MSAAKNLNVLVVEDDDFQRLALVQMMLALGANEVLEAEDGEQALALIRNSARVNLILCDLDMPGMDGIEFMRHLGQARSNAAVIINSAKGQSLMDSVVKMARGYGVRFLGVIAKPTSQAKIASLLTNYEPPKLPANHFPVAEIEFSLDEILSGIVNKQIFPFFQPKIDFETNLIIGAEALARWDHPVHGLIYPKVFIKSLESNNEIDGLTMLMLEKSAIACQQWRKQGMDLTVAVNISLVSLADVRLADYVTNLVRGAGLDPQYMVLEITESAVMANMNSVLENVMRLRMRGFGLSIDDYGTGFSSLQRLGQIPFTELKIDQSFVSGCSTNPSVQTILESSIDMAHRLNLKCVAEGVESQADWDFLKSLHCDVAQGYFIANPMDEALFLSYLATNYSAQSASCIAKNTPEAADR
ncbi:MAG: EAL domain-containing response regulator [Candidatus Nitrotoga sp.]